MSPNETVMKSNHDRRLQGTVRTQPKPVLEPNEPLVKRKRWTRSWVQSELFPEFRLLWIRWVPIYQVGEAGVGRRRDRHGAINSSE